MVPELSGNVVLGKVAGQSSHILQHATCTLDAAIEAP
jgi:hypothetical protein